MICSIGLVRFEGIMLQITILTCSKNNLLNQDSKQTSHRETGRRRFCRAVLALLGEGVNSAGKELQTANYKECILCMKPTTQKNANADLLTKRRRTV